MDFFGTFLELCHTYTQKFFSPSRLAGCTEKAEEPKCEWSLDSVVVDICVYIICQFSIPFIFRTPSLLSFTAVMKVEMDGVLSVYVCVPPLVSGDINTSSWDHNVFVDSQ